MKFAGEDADKAYFEADYAPQLKFKVAPPGPPARECDLRALACHILKVKSSHILKVTSSDLGSPCDVPSTASDGTRAHR